MLIFLDIDGVMVPARGWKSPELLDDGFPAFSGQAVDALQNLISKDTTVMLTTSHKMNYTTAEWIAIFLNRGIHISNIKSLGANIDQLSRKDEILRWFNAHISDENFIIIDDDKSLLDLPAFLKERLILTSPLIGLTSGHVTIAKSLLKRPHWEVAG